MDIVYVGAAILFFAASWALVRLVAGLGGSK
jgi:hypothetical protein